MNWRATREQKKRCASLLLIVGLILVGCSSQPALVANEVEPGVLEFVSGIDSLDFEINDVVRLAGSNTYTSTETQVPFRFAVPGTEAWFGASQDEWHITVPFTIRAMNENVIGPAIIVSVAEVGATPELVSNAIQASATEFEWTQSDGLFEGRETTILEATIDRDTVVAERGETTADLIVLATGTESRFPILIRDERNYRIQIFEEEGRVALVALDVPAGFEAAATAEAAPVLASLEIGGSG